mmetsp:Transcript_34070/g.98027  ORF Transcript_34070/g.98027 Transcript_34070/m.98027 type:complete len:217 (+) Transcript_34070:35-685(+)
MTLSISRPTSDNALQCEAATHSLAASSCLLGHSHITLWPAALEAFQNGVARACCRQLTLRGAGHQAGRDPAGGPEQLLEPELAPQLHPVVHVPDVRHGLAGVGQRLLVARRAVLADHRRDLLPTGNLCLPDRVPPPLVAFHVREPFGGARIRHLRAVVVADTAVRMVHLWGDVFDDLCEVHILCVGLGNVDPMRKVSRDLHLRKLRQEVACDPGAV